MKNIFAGMGGVVETGGVRMKIAGMGVMRVMCCCQLWNQLPGCGPDVTSILS